MNLISLGIFGIIFLMILGLVSNSSTESQENIQEQMFLMNCPLPAYDAQWNATNVTIKGFTVILNNSAGVAYGGDGTVFRCRIDELASGTGFQVLMTNKDYKEVTLGFPSGWFKYAGDWIGSAFQRINNMFALVGFFVLPTGFNIIGFAFEDLTGYALFIIVFIYALCYLFIGAMMYKIISPFVGE